MANEGTTDDIHAPRAGMVLAGRYRLERLVGEGGMGRVFLAHDQSMGRPVAVKVLSDDRPIPNAAARFARETQAIGRIDHEHVVRIADVGETPRGGLFYVMEYLQGEELADTIEREGFLGWPRARAIALQICGALQAAHACGVVHRDLKLENCFRVERGREPDFIKILDFGVAKLLGPDSDESGRLTGTGATVGTPAYMAPELCRGRAIDHRVDVYALGVMLYEMLTGRLPFEGEGFVDVAMMHMNEPPPSLARHIDYSEFPAGLDEIIARAMAKSPADRFPTMAAFGRALAAVDDTVAAVPPIRGATEPALSSMPVVDTPHSHGGAHRAVTAVRDDSGAGHRATGGGLMATVLVAMAVVFAVAAGLLVWARMSPPSGATVKAPSSAQQEPAEASEAPSAAATPAAPSRDVPPVEDSVVGTGTGMQAETDTEDHTTDGGDEDPPPPPASPTEVRPSGWSKAQINTALRSVSPRTRTCVGGLTGGKRGDRVRLTMMVDRATGKVVSIDAKAKGSTSAVEACVEDAVRRARFARVGRGVQRVVRTLTL